MTIPTNADLPPEGWETDDAGLPDEAPEKLPFLRITASYAGSLDHGRPDTVTVDLNVAGLDDQPADTAATADLDEYPSAGLIRLIVETIAALRREPQPTLATVIVNAGAGMSAEGMARFLDRLVKAQQARAGTRRGRKGLDPEVIDRIFGREPATAAAGGPVPAEATATADDPGPIERHGHTVRDVPDDAPAHTLNHPGSDRWTGGDRKDGE